MDAVQRAMLRRDQGINFCWAEQALRLCPDVMLIPQMAHEAQPESTDPSSRKLLHVLVGSIPMGQHLSLQISAPVQEEPPHLSGFIETTVTGIGPENQQQRQSKGGQSLWSRVGEHQGGEVGWQQPIDDRRLVPSHERRKATHPKNCWSKGSHNAGLRDGLDREIVSARASELGPLLEIENRSPVLSALLLVIVADDSRWASRAAGALHADLGGATDTWDTSALRQRQRESLAADGGAGASVQSAHVGTGWCAQGFLWASTRARGFWSFRGKWRVC